MSKRCFGGRKRVLEDCIGDALNRALTHIFTQIWVKKKGGVKARDALSCRLLVLIATYILKYGAHLNPNYFVRLSFFFCLLPFGHPLGSLLPT